MAAFINDENINFALGNVPRPRHPTALRGGVIRDTVRNIQPSQTKAVFTFQLPAVNIAQCTEILRLLNGGVDSDDGDSY
jgi:hypothetical protein